MSDEKKDGLVGNEAAILVVDDEASGKTIAEAIKAGENVIVPDQDKAVEVQIDKGETAAYLRLVSVYEGDVEMEPGQYISSFILKLVDLDGREFMCPVYTLENYRDGVRKSLQRIKPLILSQFDTEVDVKEGAVSNVIDISEIPPTENKH